MAATPTTTPAASSFAVDSLVPDNATHLPTPHALDAHCDCYACRWRSADRSVSYPAFPDLTRPPFAPGAPGFNFRCSPGVLLGAVSEGVYMDPGTGFPSSMAGDDTFPQWHRDPALRAQVLARFLQNPHPPTALEREAHIRPLNLVDLAVPWKDQNPNDPANEHVDPMLVDPHANPTDVDNLPQLAAEQFIDFDILDGASTAHSFRMQFNGGWADANTGWYATIRDRTTCFLVGIATSTESDSSTVVTCLDDNLMARFVEHPDLPPVDLLMPPFRPDLGEYGKIWSADTKNDLNQDVCSWHDPDPVLDPFRHRIHSHGTIASSYAHQLELFFAIAASITPNSFETRLDTPAAVAADFAEELLVSAMGTKLLPRELLRMVARWCPAAIYWAHFDTQPPG
ncbi:hypothetical protein HDU88_001113 [Geranomyces variabilis]|nr:hypothetical protein HDU88_001113 [Geranomyces variabilis]